MFTGLVRWFGRREGRGAGPARRFVPRLEAVEDRALPSGAGGVVGQVTAQSALLSAEVGGPSDVVLFRTGTGSKPGGTGEGLLGLKATPILFGHSTSCDVTLLTDGPPPTTGGSNGLLGGRPGTEVSF
jgi:hypothetical protein